MPEKNAPSAAEDQRGPATPAKTKAKQEATAELPKAPPSPSAQPRAADNGVRRDANAQLQPGKLEQAEFIRQLWTATVPHGVSPDDVLEPGFWALYAAQFSPWAKVEVRAEDGTWYGEYIVADCSRTWAKLKPIVGPIRLTTADVSLTQSSDIEIAERCRLYDVTHRGSRKWTVVRKADGAVMTEGKSAREDAEKWLLAHVRHEIGKGPNPNEVVPA